jgi:hypothetical protein
MGHQHRARMQSFTSATQAGRHRNAELLTSLSTGEFQDFLPTTGYADLE